MEKQQLEKYINEYGRDIYLFCKRLTQNKNTADDLYQETFLKLWELDNVNDTENPKSYLLGIAVNLWKNQCRKQMWRKQIADIVPASEESQIENFSAADNVEDTVITNQGASDVEPEYDEISVQMKDGSTYVIESKSQRVKNEFYGEYGKNNDLWIGFDYILDLEQVESVTINDTVFTVAD